MAKHPFFRTLSWITLLSVFLLIFVGSLVRSTGAGMGCPDWPKCFGRWMPPLHESDLPADYRQHYADRGYDKLAFDAVKTWTEYMNRLLGVVVGLLILLTFASSWQTQNKKVILGSGISVILVIFQGWLGSMVVKSNLNPWLITLHMTLALALLAVLIATRFAHQPRYDSEAKRIQWPLVLISMLCLIQFFLGIQVREEVDHFLSAVPAINRALWASQLTNLFDWHRGFSWVVAASTIWLALKSLRHPLEKSTKHLITLLVCLVLTAMLAGLGLPFLAFPPLLQPIHLIIASLIFSVQVSLLLKTQVPG